MDDRQYPESLEALLARADEKQLSRRAFLRGTLASGAGLSLTALIAACGGDGAEEAAPPAPAPAPAPPAETEAAPPAATTAAEGEATRGGRLRAGVLGGGDAESLDPHKALAAMDAARTQNIFDRLTEQAPDGSTVMGIAESFEPNATADVWTVKLREGITWHDGKPLTADDVIYSYQRILDPDEALQGAADISMIDPNGMRKVDDVTIEFTLLSPYADLPTPCSQRSLGIIQDGATDFTNPIGTGPFKYQDFTIGQRSLFVRNENYWQEGLPYVDELELLSIADPAARVNALRGGQVDAIAEVDLAQAQSLQESGDVQILSSETGHWVPITFQVTAPPFDDLRVRQALRLIVDRQQIVDQALLGFGFVGNDLFCPFDPNYASDLPQREQDIEQAKALLAEAGQEGLTFDLNSSQAAGGMLESALLFAEQAKAAGVTVNVKRTPPDSYWNDVYLKVPAAQSDWANRALDPQILQAVDCKAPYNETTWCREDFDALTAEARATIDEAQRRDLYHQAQEILYDEGGYIIWGFANWVDAFAPNVTGFVPHAARNLSYWGFKDMWLS